jgi:hypothetical protein
VLQRLVDFARVAERLRLVVRQRPLDLVAVVVVRLLAGLRRLLRRLE